MKTLKAVKTFTKVKKGTIKHKGIVVLTYEINYPEFFTYKYVLATFKMNAFYYKLAEKYEKEIKKTLAPNAIADAENSIKNGFPVRAYEAMTTFSVTYNANCSVSIYTDKYEYTGGAHGNTLRTSQTWNLSTAKQMQLKAFFPNEKQYIEKIKRKIKKEIAHDTLIGKNTYFDNAEELVDKTFSPKQFYLTPKGMVFYFQQYDIAPYSSGIPTFTFTFKELNAEKPHCI